jgi:hypothetical protein
MPSESISGRTTMILHSDTLSRGTAGHFGRLWASCRPVVGGWDFGWPATVRLLTDGVVSLSSDLPFEQGAILEVDLRTGMERGSVSKLVIVDRVRPETGDRWSMDGIFIHPLSPWERELLARTMR